MSWTTPQTRCKLETRTRNPLCKGAVRQYVHDGDKRDTIFPERGKNQRICRADLCAIQRSRGTLVRIIFPEAPIRGNPGDQSVLAGPAHIEIRQKYIIITSGKRPEFWHWILPITTCIIAGQCRWWILFRGRIHGGRRIGITSGLWAL